MSTSVEIGARESELRHFQVDEGLSLVGECWGAPENPPVILLHGGGQTRHSWAGTARMLAADGWYAMAVDMRGHGESDWAPDGNYHHLAFARDVIGLAEEFHEPPVLIGASLGGIASLLAIHIAEKPLARSLILVDIATQMEPDGAARIVNFMRSRPDGFESLEDVADAVAAYNPHRPRPRDLSGLRKNLRQRDDGRFTWHWDPKFLRHPGNPDERPEEFHQAGLLDRAAESLEIPTLLVRGRMSDLLSEEGAQNFLRQVPHASFADVSGAGHMVAGDRNDLFTQAVRDFLGRV